MLYSLSGQSKEELLNKLIKSLNNLGLIFQIVDDLLNIEESTVAENKGVIGEDIKEGKVTYMTIYAIQHLTEDSKKRLTSLLALKGKISMEEIQEVISLISSSGAIEAAKGRIKELHEDIDLDETFRDPCIRSLFAQLISYVIDRKS